MYLNILTPQSIPRDIAVLCALILPVLVCLIYLGIIPFPIGAQTLPVELRNPYILWAAALIPAFIWGYCLGYIFQFLLLKSQKFHWKALLSLLIIAGSIWYVVDFYQQYKASQASGLTEVGGEYQLFLVSDLSEITSPNQGQVYVQKDGAQLKYTLKNFKGETFSGRINMDINELWLTNRVLQKYKYDILQLLSDRGEISSVYETSTLTNP